MVFPAVAKLVADVLPCARGNRGVVSGEVGAAQGQPELWFFSHLVASRHQPSSFLAVFGVEAFAFAGFGILDAENVSAPEYPVTLFH
jgi:hypothetical protein